MKVVLDTNVFVSGLLWKGTVSNVVKAWTDGKFDVVLSTGTFEELRRILTDLGKGRVDIPELLTMVASKGLWVTAKPLDRQICSDADDDKFIAVALSGRTRYIVTGDKALLAVKTINGVDILTPRAFLNQLP
jgi:uncharacterized protein